MAESLVLSTGVTDLTLTDDANGITVVSHEYPAPPPKNAWAGSIDSEGSVPLAYHHENREISVVVETTTAAKLTELQAVVALIGREGGTLTWVMPNGNTVTFDLLKWSSYEARFDIGFSVADYSRVSMVFPAKPYGLGTQSILAGLSSSTLPVLEFTVSSAVALGDVPALGELTVTNSSATDQAWMVWGQQSRYYSADASAELFFEAQDLTPLGATATATGATGVSSSAVMRNTALLEDQWTAFVGFEIAATSDVFSHIGDFRVFARCYAPATNTGDIDVALEWSTGDQFRTSQNRPATLGAAKAGSWRLLDLGPVSLPEVSGGTQQWTGRVVARSTVDGDELDADWFMLVPTTEGSGEVTALPSSALPDSFDALDKFDQTAGALSGKTADVGGTWATAGSTTDLAVSGSGAVTRSTTGDSGPRLGALGATDFTSVAVQTLTSGAAAGLSSGGRGVVARYVDASNYLAAWVEFDTVDDVDGTGMGALKVATVLSGAETVIATSSPFTVPADLYVRVVVMPNGTATATAYSGDTAAVIASTSGSSSVLATGGTLATGRPGLYDLGTSTAATRTYSTFWVWDPTQDAAIYNGQSLELRHDGVIREDAAGAVTSPVSRYEGDLLLVPPGGPEDRTLRVIVKTSRGVPGEGIDAGSADGLDATLTLTSRHLVVGPS